MATTNIIHKSISFRADGLVNDDGSRHGKGFFFFFLWCVSLWFGITRPTRKVEKVTKPEKYNRLQGRKEIDYKAEQWNQIWL